MNAARSAEWLERVESIRPYIREGVRAPYKPLLLLYALGRLQRGLPLPVRFCDTEGKLQELIGEFGPPSGRVRPEYPFYHLQNDGLWVLDPPVIPKSTSPSARQLRDEGISGQLAPDFAAALRADPTLFAAVVHKLLDGSFPRYQHTDICAAVGLDIENLEI